MTTVTVFALFILVFLFFSILVLASAIRIVPEYQRAVVFRLGRCIGHRGPGMILLIPSIDRAILVDLREQTRTLPAQSAISADNVRLTVDISWNYKVIDPAQSVLAVGNLDEALKNIATQFWPSQVEARPWQETIQNRPRLRAELLGQLEEASRKWGIQVTGAQLGEIQKAG